MARRDGDYMQDIIRYVESNLKSGYREDQLRFLLLNQGYSRSAVDKAFRAVALRMHNEPAHAPAEPARVEFVDNNVSPVKKQGFFSRLFGGLFSSKKKSEPKSQSSYSASSSDTDFLEVDTKGNLVK